MSDTEACENTDKEIWRGPDKGNGDAYADSIHVTRMGGISFNCGGHVIVRSPKSWHSLALRKPPQRYDITNDEMIEVTQEWVDLVQKQMMAFGMARQAARKALYNPNDRGVIEVSSELQAFLDAWSPDFLGTK